MELREILPCVADPTKLRAIGKVDVRDFRRVMPYLARLIPGATYSERDEWISFKKGQKIITVYGDGFVTMAYIRDKMEAMEILKDIEEKARKAWEKREQIDISKPVKRAVSPLDVYSYLPKTNCRECGEQTCMAFAVKLLNGEKDIRDCKPLFREKKYAGIREALADMLL